MFTRRNSIVLVTILTLAGCTTDDEDRCAANYEWDNENEVCIPENSQDSDSGTEAFDTATDSDTGAVDTATEQDSDGSGLGVPCMEPADCADFQASMCLTDPGNPSAGGTCTIPDCVAADCTGDFSCCDCTESAMFPQESPICIPGEVLDLFVNKLGCPCE